MIAVLGAVLTAATSTSTKVSAVDVGVFAVAAAIVLAGAIGVVAARNPVHSALMLVMTLFGIAVLFVLQRANFLAAVQVIVYAGAIVVLFLFVIMFLGVDRREDIETEPLTGQRPLAFLMVGITLAGVIAMLATSHWVTGAHQVVGPIEGAVTKSPGSPSGEVAQLGKQLFTTYLFAFEATAALLVIAVVGAVVLARRPGTPEHPEKAEAEAGLASGPELASTSGPELANGSELPDREVSL
jgi:NADH-quinone oxidoreductase subunit J